MTLRAVYPEPLAPRDIAAQAIYDQRPFTVAQTGGVMEMMRVDKVFDWGGGTRFLSDRMLRAGRRRARPPRARGDGAGMKTAFGHDQVVEELRRRCPKRGMRAGVAAELGVGEAEISFVLRGERLPGHRMAQGLGFRRVIRFERAE